MGEKYYSQINDVQLSSNKYVLVLPGWYPTWQDAYAGDFNQRHVMAAGLQKPQVVLYISKDITKRLTNIETRYKQVTSNIVEITVIYPHKKNKRIDAFYSNFIFLKLLYDYSDIIKNRWGKPLLIHSYIVIRGGLAGLLLGKKWKLPFILSENWTIYYPEDPGYLFTRNIVFRYMVKKIFENLYWFLPVTENLKNQVRDLLQNVPFSVVPNAVDIRYFFFNNKVVKQETFTFVHVSTMVYQKNPQGLLRSFKRFNALHSNSCLQMVGPWPEDVVKYAKDLGLSEKQIHFTGPVAYEQVAKILQLSNALVMFSRYENLPCVILEALCCGLPVISTSVGGISEVIDMNNGLLLKNENEEQLTVAFTNMFINYTNYHREKIAENAENLYSYQTVGNLINSVYNDVISAN